MDFHSRRARSLAILKDTGIWRCNYEPPYLRLLWRMGIDMPPPHFMPFFQTVILAAAWFSGAWGVCMWFSVWSQQGLNPTAAIAISSCAGLFFGFSMALYYAHARRKYSLPSWTSLGEAQKSK
jgi:hypothetical protein